MKSSKISLAVVAVLLLVVLTFPLNVSSSRTHHLYVDEDSSGKQDGSKDHPYKSIEHAIREASGKTEIHVANGEYKEHFTLKKDIKLFGEDRSKTIINGNDNKPVVTMRDNSEINGVTIKDGSDGIHVEENASAKIINCVIKGNHDDGVDIDEGSTDSSEEVIITTSSIRDNGRAGIYSEKRKLTIMDNNISFNGSDGINIETRSKLWMSGNEIKGNRGSGVKLAIDGSSFWTKGNEVRNNKREGFEIVSFGGSGRVNIEKSKIVENSRYGIAKVQRVGNSNWNQNLTFQGIGNDLWGNPLGSISGVVFAR